MKGKLNYLFSVLAFLSCFALVTAQEVIVRAELDTNRALIGDQLRLSLTVVKPANLHIKFPQLKATITRKIEIVRDSYSDTASVSQDRVSLGRNLLTVRCLGPQAAAAPVALQKAEIHVAYVPGAPQRARGA